MYTSEYDIKKAILQVLCDVDNRIWKTFHPNFAEEYSAPEIDDIYECKCAILKGEYMFWLNVAALNGTAIEPTVTVRDCRSEICVCFHISFSNRYRILINTVNLAAPMSVSIGITPTLSF